MPLRSSGCLLLLLQALSPLVAGSKSSLDVSGQRIAVLYVGLPCRFHSFKHLPNLWHNQETLLLRPLRQHYSTVDVYGFFNEHKVVDGVNYGLKNHMQKNYEPPSAPAWSESQLTKWQQLVFSDTDEELFEEGMTSGEMGDRRRFVALRRFTTTQVNSTLKCAYDRVLVLRPDLWFRQPWSAWNISERVDLHVSHWECDGRLACLESPRKDGRVSDAFFYMSARFVEGLVNQPMQLRPKLERFRLPFNVRNPLYRKVRLMPFRVLAEVLPADARLLAPLYSVGKKCCYATTGGEGGSFGDSNSFAPQPQRRFGGTRRGGRVLRRRVAHRRRSPRPGDRYEEFGVSGARPPEGPGADLQPGRAAPRPAEAAPGVLRGCSGGLIFSVNSYIAPTTLSPLSATRLMAAEADERRIMCFPRRSWAMVRPVAPP